MSFRPEHSEVSEAKWDEVPLHAAIAVFQSQ